MLTLTHIIVYHGLHGKKDNEIYVKGMKSLRKVKQQLKETQLSLLQIYFRFPDFKMLFHNYLFLQFTQKDFR